MRLFVSVPSVFVVKNRIEFSADYYCIFDGNTGKNFYFET